MLAFLLTQIVSAGVYNKLCFFAAVGECVFHFMAVIWIFNGQFIDRGNEWLT